MVIVKRDQPAAPLAPASLIIDEYVEPEHKWQMLWWPRVGWEIQYISTMITSDSELLGSKMYRGIVVRVYGDSAPAVGSGVTWWASELSWL